MKKYLLMIFTAMFIVSCGNSSKNKIDATDAQDVATGEGENLNVDINSSVINWTGYKPGGSHHGTLKLKEGTLVLNGTEVVSGAFIIDMNSIVNIDLTDEKMNKMLVDHLKSEDFFDVVKFPESSFSITKIEAVTGDSITHVISGNLKMKDKEKNISFGANITKEGNVYKAVSVPFAIDRTQWDVKYGSKSLFAELKDNFINDDIELQIVIEAQAQQ